MFPKFLLFAGTKSAGGISSIARMILSYLPDDIVYNLQPFDSNNYPPLLRLPLNTFRLVYFIYKSPKNLPLLIFSSAFYSFYEKVLWSVLAHLLRRKTYIFLVDGNFPSFWNNLPLIFQSFFYRLLLFARVEFFVQSSYWLDYYQRIFPLINSCIVPATVTPEFLTYIPPEHKDIDVLYCGWIMSQKGIHDLLKALSIILLRFPNLKVILIGPAIPSKEYWSSIIVNLGLQDNVQILNPIHDKNLLIQYYRRSAIFVLPTHAEGFPVSLIEAMSQGMPIISTNISSIPDIVIHNVTGLLVEPSMPLQLAHALEYLLSSDSVRSHMSNTSLRIFRDNYTPENFSAVLANISNS